MKYAAKFTALIFFLFPLLLQIKVLIDICNSTRGVCIAGMFYSYETCDRVQNITLKNSLTFLNFRLQALQVRRVSQPTIPNPNLKPAVGHVSFVV